MASTACFLHQTALSATSTFRSSSQRNASSIRSAVLLCRSQKQIATEDSESDYTSETSLSRRYALSVLIGAATVDLKASPADAAYGEPANIFGKAKKSTGFLPYNGEGFKILIPAQWNPSKEVEFDGQVMRYEDNFDANSNVSVIVQPTTKKSITDYGSPENFLSEVDFLLGRQVYFGKTQSEGGFDKDQVAQANLLESSSLVIDSKPYYSLHLLTRTADGGEGGKHQVITGTVSDGKLYVCKVQAGDKRWFKGAKKFVEGTATSFSVA